MNRISLNGTWKVVPDPSITGKAECWYNDGNLLSQESITEMEIPNCLETKLPDYEGVAWFYKSFSAPSINDGDCVRLCFGAVNYRAEVYLNGTPVGYHDGGYTGFEFEITDLLQAENELIVRVITPLITKKETIDGIGYNEMPHWRGAITGGIWQDVSLLVTGSTYLSEPYTIPDIHRHTVKVGFNVNNTCIAKQNIQIKLAIFEDWSGNLVQAQSKVINAETGSEPFETIIGIPGARLWSPDHPNLYRAELSAIAEDGSISDKQSILFGMREFTVRGKYFYLNDEKIILKGAFYEGFYPYTLAFPETPELIEKEMRLAKEAGMNLIRPWRKPQPPIVYEMADRMGLLMIGSIACECMKFWPQLSPFMEERLTHDLEEMIIRDRNHASIIIWEIFNEIHRKELKRLRHKLALKIRKHDESRAIIDESGGFYDGAKVYLPWEYQPTVIADVHFYPGAPMNNSTYKELFMLGKSKEDMQSAGLTKGANTESLIIPDVLTNITEIGYGASPDLVSVMNTYAQKCNPITPDYYIHKRLFDSYTKVLERTGILEEFGNLQNYLMAEQERHAMANKDMLEASRVNPDVAGIGIHAFVDGDWVVGAGMLDIHRNPKKAYYTLKQTYSDIFVAARSDKRNYFPNETVTVSCFAVNDLNRKAGPYSLEIRDKNGNTVYSNVTDVAVEKTAMQLKPAVISGLAEGTYTITVSWMGITNTNGFSVMAPSAIIRKPVEIYDPEQKLASFLAKYNIPCQIASDGSGLIFAAGNLTEESGKWLAGRAATGATIILLDLPIGEKLVADELVLKEGLLPFPIRTYESFGYWTPSNHIIRKNHPLFAGLPSGMMDENYQNVSPRRSVRTGKSDWEVGVIGYGWWQNEPWKQNYTGVSEAFDAADVFWQSWGKGRYLISTLRLTENLGIDPYADQILLNLIKWMESENENR